MTDVNVGFESDKVTFTAAGNYGMEIVPFAPIDPAQCVFVVTPNNVQITLWKSEPVMWTALTPREHKLGNVVSDWERFEEDEEDAKMRWMIEDQKRQGNELKNVDYKFTEESWQGIQDQLKHAIANQLPTGSNYDFSGDVDMNLNMNLTPDSMKKVNSQLK